jgi:hypothetical protein
VTVPAGAFAQELHQSPYVVTPADKFVSKGGNDAISNIIYINDCKPSGCFIRAGASNDAREDISTIAQQDTIISPFLHDQQVWDDTIECLRQVYGPYDVQIVTEDPGEALHHEAILAGYSNELGLPAGVGGVAPFNCVAQNNVISFSFANQLGDDVIELCWTVAQESAHAFGLDHAFECLDPMTYIPGCGQKFFRNDALPCGEDEPRSCTCGGDRQNSHISLLSVFGPGTPAAAPQVAITYPADGAQVNNNLVIQATATDPRLVHRIELHINGWLYETQDGHAYGVNSPYQFNVPQNLPDGVMDIEIKAYNDLDSEAIAAVTVTKGEPCAAADTCLEGQQCNDGRCAWPLPTGQLGDSCAVSMECESLLCPRQGNTGYCSQYCIPLVADQCPAGFDCQAAGDSGVCWPLDEGGGCCSVGPSRPPSGGHIALFLMCAAFVLRRRRANRVR